MAIPGPMDEIARITIILYGGGQMSVGGNIGDKKMALMLLANAHAQVKAQLRPEDEKKIIVPSIDVDVRQHPNYPTKPLGDMTPHNREAVTQGM